MSRLSSGLLILYAVYIEASIIYILYYSNNIGFQTSEKPLGAQFQPVKLELDYVEAERIGGKF